MKRVYESPVMRVELFVANQAVSSCTIFGEGVTYKFDCMFGPDVDTGYVINDTIATGCKNKIGYESGITVARDYSSRGSHSNNNQNRATWEYVNGSKGQSGYLQVTYSGAEGILFTDGEGGKYDNCWSVESGYVKHSSSGGGMHHMVAPVINPNDLNTSW